MESRLLARLDAAIAQCVDPVEADVLCAQRIGQLARIGRLEEARSELQPLRARHDARPDAATAAAIGLADALVDYFSDLGGEPRAKLQQARVLSASAGRHGLQALCAAWLAHFDYVANDTAAVARHAALALTLAAPDAHSARSRASLVVAMAYHHAARLDLAHPWYVRARQHAGAEGDTATMSALLHNMAALRASLARSAAVLQGGIDHREEALYALIGAESSEHFDDHVGGSALPVLQPILRAQMLAVQGRHQEALSLYESCLGEALATGLSRLECSLRADIAWCRIQVGEPQRARQEAQAAAAALRPDCDIDDVALTHGRLAQVWRELGEAPRAQRHAQQAQSFWQRHTEQQARSVTLLDEALRRVPR